MNKVFYLTILAAMSVLAFSCSTDDELDTPQTEPSAGGSYDPELDIYSDWQKTDSVYYYISNKKYTQFTPWSEDYSESSHIPVAVIEEMRAEDSGWILEFSGFNNDKAKDLPYFVFYNRFTGIMRVMYFVSPVLSLTNASDVSFAVNFAQGNDVSSKYAAANMMTYGVPAAKVEKAAVNYNINGNSNPTFTTYISPYDISPTSFESKAITLDPGWWAFDVDMSAYNPKNTGILFNISGRGRESHTLNVYGAIKANITGDISKTQQVEAFSSSSGAISEYFSIGKHFYEGYVSSLISAVKKPTDIGNYINLIKTAVKDFSGMGKGEITYAPEYESRTLIGDINASITGDIQLSGLIDSYKPTGISSLIVDSRNKKYNGHLGEGIWGLEKAPVVYVVKDALVALGAFNLFKDSEGIYSGADIEDANPCLFTFFDPSSIELNLAPGFANAKDITINAYTCVYPKEAIGHTANFGAAFGQEMIDKLVVTTNSKLKSRQPKNGDMTTYFVDKEDLAVYNEGDVKEDLVKYGYRTKLSGTNAADSVNINYYGYHGGDDVKNAIIDPVVSLPFMKTQGDTYKVYDPVLPDFVVAVTLSFYCDGRTFFFSKRFLPDVRGISMAELKGMKDKLKGIESGKERGKVNIDGLSYGFGNGVYAVKRALKVLETTK